MRHLKCKSNRINLTMTLVLKPLQVCGYVFLMKKYMCSLYYLEKSFLKSKLTGVTLDRVNAWRSSVLLSVTAWGSFMCFYRPFGHSLVRIWDSFSVFLRILCLHFYNAIFLPSSCIDSSHSLFDDYHPSMTGNLTFSYLIST